MGRNHSPHIVTRGLILDVDAKSPKSYGGSGTVWTDITRNGYNGNLINSPTYTGNSMVFNGHKDPTGSYVAFSSPVVTSAFTELSVEIWVNTTTATTEFLMTNSAQFETNSFYLTKENATQFAFLLNGPGGYSEIYSNKTYGLNQWYNIIGTWKSGEWPNIYQNGELSSGTQEGVIATSIFTGATNLTIAREGPLSVDAFNFTGQVGLSRIYNRVLTASEVKQNYDAMKSRFGIFN